MLRTRILWVVALVAVLGAFPGLSQAKESAPKEPVPEEYGRDEFPPFLRHLRRGEIILFGVFPFSLFVSYETYDIYRFFANDRQSQYAPWPFRRPDAVPYSTGETVGVLVSAVTVSLLVAVTDYIIGRIVEKRAAERANPDR